MKNKYKKKLVKVFSVFVSLLMVFALLPTAVNAADNTIYSADGIDITVDKGDIGVRTDISFTVRVDGVIVAEDVLVEDIGASSGTIHIATITPSTLTVNEISVLTPISPLSTVISIPSAE